MSLWCRSRSLGRNQNDAQRVVMVSLRVVLVPWVARGCRPLWLPWFLRLFLPCEKALAVRDQKFAFPHAEFNGDRAKKWYYFCIPLYLPLCRPLWLPLFLPLFLPCEKALAVRGQQFAFPHKEFNGDRTKKGLLFHSFISSLMSPLMTPFIYPFIFSMWNGLGRQRPNICISTYRI